jgi:geranyl-CoA carboxylase alpha subunit
VFASLLIANRGEIALRVQRTARRMGLRTIAVYSDADAEAPHTRAADAAVRLGGAAPRDSYLNIAAILEAAKRTGAQAVHAGYGFLAESAAFAETVLQAGLVWVGPPPAAIRAMGDKGNAKRIAHAAGVPVLREYLTHGAIDFPVMVKAAAGGGGRGMRLARSPAELPAAIAAARSEAEHAFGDGRVLLEPAIEGARHVEVQVFGDARGRLIHLGERDCSVQRRHQKLIEESPSPAVDGELRRRLGAAAIAAARAVEYAGAGTVEFLLAPGGEFYFMEMNTRLQVEHPVTELVTGLDLVEWQLRVAAGEPLPIAQEEIRFQGHAIEARLCAEDVSQGFLPQAGTIALWQPAPGVRVDHALESGCAVPPYYDSMIAKLAAHAPGRDEARAQLARALDATVALGLATNKSFLAAVLRDEAFARGEATTDWLSRFAFRVEEPDAAACAIAAALLAEHAGYGEWTSWSNNPAREMRFRFAEDVALRFAAGVYSAATTRGAARLRLFVIGNNRARVELDRARGETVAYAVDGDTLHLARGGASYRLENTIHAPAAQRGAEVGDGRLASPMNGRVLAVHARAGERVDAGKALVVLEAMKMEHGLALQVPVRVRAVHVAAGAQVAPGHLLLEFEPAAAHAPSGSTARRR